MFDLDDLRRIFTGTIRLSEPLAPCTTYKIGGPADVFLEPATVDDVANAVFYLAWEATGVTAHTLIVDCGVTSLQPIDSCIST